MRARRPRRRTALTLLLVAAAILFAAFELGVRLPPPDAVEYQERLSNNGEVAGTAQGTTADPATVARLRAAIAAHPVELSANLYLARVQGADTCAPLSEYSASYRFTWRGLPVETIWPAGTCGDRGYTISSGGLSDPRVFAIDAPLIPLPGLP